MAEFLMPSLGADMADGRLVTWLKKPGDRVQRGDIIAEVETDKGVIEVEVFTSGTVEKLLVEEGTKVPVGVALALIREGVSEGSAPAAPKRAEPPVRPASAVQAKPPPAFAPASAPPPASALASAPPPPAATPQPARLRLSPAARRLARELGLDPTGARGSGPDGALTRADIEALAKARHPAPEPEPSAPAPRPAPERAESRRATSAGPENLALRMRQAIAAAMSRSNREIPHYYVAHTIDMTIALDWLTETNAARPIAERILPGALLLKAVALALVDYPEFNGRWENDQLVSNSRINVGSAISLRNGGLVIPAILETDQRSLDELMHKLQDVVERARRGQLRSSELSEGTITVTSLGERGVQSVYGVIYPPQVALVGFGKVTERPWVSAGHVVPRPLLDVTLAADHRASDGHRGALFLAKIEKLLLEPEAL